MEKQHLSTLFVKRRIVRKKTPAKKEENERRKMYDFTHQQSFFTVKIFLLFPWKINGEEFMKTFRSEAHTKSGQYFFRMIRKTFELFFFNYPSLSASPKRDYYF